MKRIATYSNLIYFVFALLFTIWVLATYRNIVHMDMIKIIGTKVKPLFEHKLHLIDFIYSPLFPCIPSIIFTLINAWFFHLNTVLETLIGCIFLVLLGYKYLHEISSFLQTRSQKVLFALLVGFIVFGLHKWEAVFTSFFSFAVFFNLCICFYNYFFLLKYIDQDLPGSKGYGFPGFLILNLLVILEFPAYFYAYILSIIILLFLIKYFRIFNIHAGRWNNSFFLSIFLFLFAFIGTICLSKIHAFKHDPAGMDVSHFFKALTQRPGWFIEFYLVAHSGPFLGEASNNVEARALFGLIVLAAYAIAFCYVIKRKDKRLLVPLALIFYNIISYGFITMGRYIFNSLEYGTSPRYTAFNMSGVLGLTTILFFYILEGEKIAGKRIAISLLVIIISGYVYVDYIQLTISKYRNDSFRQMEVSLLNRTNLKILQADSVSCLKAIDVLNKYQLNVYYDKAKKDADVDYLSKIKSFTISSGSSDFEGLYKNGFYKDENGISWTNGNASITFDKSIVANDSFYAELNTIMPPACRNISPKIIIIDMNGKGYPSGFLRRDGDQFVYGIHADHPIQIRGVSIISDTIPVQPPDIRVLSFPFKSLAIKDEPLLR